MKPPSGELYSLLGRRRMARAYHQRSVPRAVLLRVLDAARRVPSAGHAQGVRFAVVTQASRRAAVARLLGEQEYAAKGFPAWLSGAPVHLLVGSSQSAYQERYSEPDKSTGPARWPLPYDVLDGGKALMALYLAAEREGLACGYLGPHRAEPATGLFAWPADWRFLGLVTLGYPDRAADRSSRSHGRGWRDFDSVIHFWDEDPVR
jgi:5,6-dimethylbenzimidazole synthase